MMKLNSFCFLSFLFFFHPHFHGYFRSLVLEWICNWKKLFLFHLIEYFLKKKKNHNHTKFYNVTCVFYEFICNSLKFLMLFIHLCIGGFKMNQINISVWFLEKMWRRLMILIAWVLYPWSIMSWIMSSEGKFLKMRTLSVLALSHGPMEGLNYTMIKTIRAWLT